MNYDTFLAKFRLPENVSINIFVILHGARSFLFPFYYVYFVKREVYRKITILRYLLRKTSRRIRNNSRVDPRMERGFFCFSRSVKSHYGTARRRVSFKNESKAILAVLVALSSECTGVYHALGNRLWLSATRLERRLTWHAASKLYR